MESWRNATDPRVCAIFTDLFQLLNEGMGSGQKGDIVVERISYWPNGLGFFEAARTVKKDLTKIPVQA